MLRTFLFMTVFWIFMVLSIIFLVPLYILSIPGLGKGKELFVLALTRFWARFVLFTAGVRIDVRGLENLPEERNLCFVSNHQSYFDIPVIMASLPRIIGFMAKIELKYWPFLSTWMKQIGCIFLDRKNPKQALKMFDEGARQIRNGKAKLIFPEGTRSKGSDMGPIRPGALKLAFRAEAVIIPITLDGTYRFLEENKKLSSGRAVLTIHPPVPTAGLSREDQKTITGEIAARIASSLPEQNHPAVSGPGRPEGNNDN